MDLRQINNLLAEYIIQRVNPGVYENGSIQTIHDPSMGMGVLLLHAVKYLHENYSYIDWTINKDNIHGYETDIETRYCALQNMHDYTSFNFSPTMINIESIKKLPCYKYDIIVSNLPRHHYNGTRSGNIYNNRTYLKYIMKSLQYNGKAATIVQNIVLSSNKSRYVQIREKLLYDFNLHHIISIDDIGLPGLSILFFDNNTRTNDIEYFNLSIENNCIVETHVGTMKIEQIIATYGYVLGNTMEIVDENLSESSESSDSSMSSNDSDESNTSEETHRKTNMSDTSNEEDMSPCIEDELSRMII
jgi:type I restriction-modification system DNA methylase subunit